MGNNTFSTITIQNKIPFAFQIALSSKFYNPGSSNPKTQLKGQIVKRLEIPGHIISFISNNQCVVIYIIPFLVDL